MRSRRGFSLNELLVMMAATSTLMMLSAGLIHRSMTWSSAARSQAVEHQTLGRLAQQFRGDVTAAETAIVESPSRVRIRFANGAEVLYLVDTNHCQRLASPPSESATTPSAPNNEPAVTERTWSEREDFRLIHDGLIRFEALGAPDRIALDAFRGTTLAKPLAKTSPPADASDTPLVTDGETENPPQPTAVIRTATRPVTLRVEVVVGQRRSLVSFPNEEDAS